MLCALTGCCRACVGDGAGMQPAWRGWPLGAGAAGRRAVQKVNNHKLPKWHAGPVSACRSGAKKHLSAPRDTSAELWPVPLRDPTSPWPSRSSPPPPPTPPPAAHQLVHSRIRSMSPFQGSCGMDATPGCRAMSTARRGRVRRLAVVTATSTVVRRSRAMVYRGIMRRRKLLSLHFALLGKMGCQSVLSSVHSWLCSS